MSKFFSLLSADMGLLSMNNALLLMFFGSVFKDKSLLLVFVGQENTDKSAEPVMKLFEVGVRILLFRG